MEKAPKKKTYDPHTAMLKAQAYCAYQERCHQEVRDKLYEWGLYSDAVENIISNLIGDNYLNEERFAKAYAGGKFRIKQWGKIKIKIALKQKRISDYCIKKGLAEINPDDYYNTLLNIINTKRRTLSEKNEMKRNYRLATYAISRGFEADLVWDAIKSGE
jgi:regulatory protein